MNSSKPGDNWTIYNCHIHTFTRRHTPKGFIKWALSDAELGRIHWARFPVYLFFILLYFGVLGSLAWAAIALSERSGFLPLLGYSFLLFFQAVLVIPIVMLVAILLALGVILVLQGIINLLIGMRSVSQSAQADSQLMQMKNEVTRGRNRLIRSNLLINLLLRINPASNDIFERTARFLKIAEQPTQRAVFDEVARQYPTDTAFVVLPMDMGFMNMGELEEPIERQHAELLEMAQASGGQIIPFYAADPRHPDIVERVRQNLAPDKFRGVKIYPNLGYKPDHPNLMQVYKLCIKGNYPVVTHCSPGGIWSYGLPGPERRANSEPLNYKRVLDTDGYRSLKFCLAHFGGAQEWVKHLKGRAAKDDEEAWVRTIYEMIASGEYPNLYTDISYTVFTPRVQGLYVDLVDYLRVLLTNERVRQRVLFGSDYYMVERESLSEKEVSLLLRSRLGEELYKQIAYTNPRQFLNIEPSAPKKAVRKKRTTPRLSEALPRTAKPARRN